MRALLLAAICAAAAIAQSDDVVLRAMRDELTRSRSLQFAGLDAPYFIAYGLDDGDSFSASASLGGLISVRHDRFRLPTLDVRVGDYKFDDSNYVASGFHFGSRYEVERFPLEESYSLLRRYFWLATDSSYKSAVEAISRKRAALKNMAQAEPLNDFAHAEAVKRIEDAQFTAIDEDAFVARVRALSAIFRAYPQVKSSLVDFEAVQSRRYLVNSEGTNIRIPEKAFYIRVRAVGLASDGMSVRDAAVIPVHDLGRLPVESDLLKIAETVAQNTTALAGAPRGEDYNGPVLFEGTAAAQLMAELLGKNFYMTRRPVMEPGRPGMFAPGELEGRLGARILPEWMDVVDDPTQTEYRGRPLFGTYEVDRDGVAPGPLSLVEKGVLKRFFLTRQPVRGFEGSNGRARMPGNFGAWATGMSNLFVRATETTPLASLRKKMTEICQMRNKPYGIIVRKMDFPSSANLDEVRRLLSGSGQSGSRPVSLPLLVYRVYADGREELVRGLRFRGLNARSLKDILAAGDDTNFFDFLDNNAPFALIGAANYVSGATVVTPSLLVDDLELHKVDDELPKLPIVPPPPLS